MPTNITPHCYYPSAADVPTDQWRHFTPREMCCKGSGALLVVPAFMDKLETLRERYGKPLKVSSGYRSPEHNAKVVGTGRNGPHTTGAAVDLAVTGADAYRFPALAIEVGFTGVGVNQTGSGRFIHLDDSRSHPRPAVWSY